MAICLRTKNHVPPFGPLSSDIMDLVLQVADRLPQQEPSQRRTTLVNAAYDFWVTSKPDMETAVSRLIEELTKTVDECPVEPSVAEENSFVLQRIDVQTLRRSLDNLNCNGAFEHTSDAYYLGYFVENQAVWSQLAPAS
ncbi:Uu.00g020580.m01.CDS01 [Anthostomella pinea]|uniref:Uu.00g020580.m01.CDS01 n=1 Tax=Anthostomella pinea TaxID=933095 RepID=A0AAI8YQQ6_9PEZI|nr:Uu.00g020580.m01.CDS01 [Anthostomella pinea]